MAVRKIMLESPSLIDIDISENSKLTVCGDTHGKCTWHHATYFPYLTSADTLNDRSTQANTMICSIFLSSTATLLQITHTYLTATLLIVAASRWKLWWPSLRSNGYIRTACTLLVVTTRPTTWTKFMASKAKWKPSLAKPCSRSVNQVI